MIKDDGFSARANDIAQEITGGEKGKKKSRRWEKKNPGKEAHKSKHQGPPQEHSLTTYVAA
jgi:hypothetical protein